MFAVVDPITGGLAWKRDETKFDREAETIKELDLNKEFHPRPSRY